MGSYPGEIEAGTYTRHRFKAQLRQPQSTTKTPKSDPNSQLFETYKHAAEACGQPMEGLSADRFEQSLAQHRTRLQEKFGSVPVEFEVHIDDGRVRIRARPQN